MAIRKSLLPSAYQQVEYIESDGYQYIDTQFVIDSNSTIKSIFAYNSTTPSSGVNNTALFGVGVGGDANAYASFEIYGTKFRAYRNYNDYLVVADADTNKHTIIFNKDNKVYFDGTPSNNFSGLTFENSLSLTLFRDAQSNLLTGANAKIYYCSIYNNGTLVRNFIPCYRKTDNVIGLYDLVNGVFYTNAGSGTFTKGNDYVPQVKHIYKGAIEIVRRYKGTNLIYQSGLLPSGYILCEYLESTGIEYIDTNYYATNTSGINIDFAYSASGNAGLCGIFQGQEPRTDTLFVTTNSGQTSSAIYLLSQGNSITNGIAPTLGTKYNAKINYLNDGKLILNYTTTGNNGSNGVVSSRTIKLFCRDSGGSLVYTNARIYRCQISEGTTLVRDLIPCLDNNGVPCMYDTVSKQTLYNQGEGEFSYKVDESVLPAGYTLCDYLESTGTQYIDTGYYATTTSGINIDYAYSASGNAGLCGIFQNQEPRTDTLFITTNSGNTSTEIYLISRGAQLTNNISPGIGTKHNAKINYLNNGKLIIDNTKTGNDGSNGVVSTRTIKLFCRDYNGGLSYTNARIYMCQISEAGNIVRNFIPCLDNNNIPCMYDVITKQTYYNAGTGTFTKGANI